MASVIGRILLQGYAALVNVNASVTRGDYGATHTVAKQAADAGASRTGGTFCKFLTGGTTPTAAVFNADLSGAALTNPMNAVGDIIQGTTAGAPARLGAGTSGFVLTAAGAATPVVWAAPAGIVHTTLGTTSIGASFQGARGTYLKKITLASAGYVAAIWAGIKGDATNLQGVAAAIYNDSGGAPINVIALGGPALVGDSSTYATGAKLNTTARLVSFGVTAWLAAGDYWLAIKLFGGADNQIYLAYASGTGSDSTQAAVTTWADSSVTSISTGTNDHTIYADILR